MNNCACPFKPIYLIALLVGALLLFATFNYKKAVKPHDELVVGMIVGYAPYASLAPDGTYLGFDIDVAQAIATALNKKLIIKDMDLSALLVALEQNKLDLVLTNLSITDAREKAVTMIHYVGQMTTSFPLAFWAKIPAGVKNLTDLMSLLPDAIICVEPGSIQEEFLATMLAPKNMRHVEAMSDVIMNLKYGKAIAAFLDPDIFPTLKKQSPELVALNIELPPAFQSRGAGIAINKENKALIQEISTIVAQLKRDGTIDRLQTKWLEN